LEAFNYNIITQTFTSQFENLFPEVIQSLDEIFITFSTMLIMNNRESDAIIALDKAQKVCNYFNAMDTLAKINLVKLSLDVRDRKIFNTDQKLIECDRYFSQTNNESGKGETLFMKALFHIY